MKADGAPVIIDFGLARHLELPDIAETAQGAAIGTPPYFAPEQVSGTKHHIDHPTVYGTIRGLDDGVHTLTYLRTAHGERIAAAVLGCLTLILGAADFIVTPTSPHQPVLQAVETGWFTLIGLLSLWVSKRLHPRRLDPDIQTFGSLMSAILRTSKRKRWLSPKRNR